ncbi:hypothetical protein B0H14DRAFT_3640292 [Mycena olivaceomarginata]|nr:hypothetical protein B0H14DRAFT_3640292 [Mycena olivaceomarginata]
MSAEPQPVSATPPPPSSPPATIASTTNNTNTNPVNSNNNTPPMASLEPDVHVDRKPIILPPGAQVPANVGEYEAGRVICEVCGGAVSFRDDNGAGGSAFTLKHWEAHRLTCAQQHPGQHPPPHPHPHPHSHPNGAHGQQPTSVPGSAYTSPPTPSCSSDPNVHLGNMYASANGPPAKRRRAKRTEEERIEYLRADVHVAQFEAYRVLCASCDKWIRLRPNSTYCSIPWDAHRKSCLAKKSNAKNIYALEERNATFQKDPDVRKFDAERILCGMCDKWLSIPVDDHPTAVQIWLHHRGTCQKTVSALKNVIANATPVPVPRRRTARSVPHRPGAAKTTLKRAEPPSHCHPDHPSPSRSPASGTLPPTPTRSRTRPRQTHLPHPDAPHLLLDLSPTNYAAPHESRRRNAEQRAATLARTSSSARSSRTASSAAYALSGCSCGRTAATAHIRGLQHRGKCLARYQRRAQKGKRNRVPQGEASARQPPRVEGRTAPRDVPARMATSLSPRRALHRIHAAKHNRSLSRTAVTHIPRRPACPPRAIPAGYAAASNSSNNTSTNTHRATTLDAEGEADDVDADGDSYMEEEGGQSLRVLRIWIRPADAAPSSSPPVDYLFRTTYEASDDMTSTREVARAAGALAAREKERYALEGDMLRLLSHESG